jgi:putative tricarboxylic transport membrane protein
MTSERGLRKGEAVLGAALVALGLFFAVQTWLLPDSPAAATVGPKLFPAIVAAGLLVVGSLLLREAFVGHVAHEKGLELDWPAVALVAGGLLAQLVLLNSVGWIPATTIVFAATARAFGSRRLLLDILIGAALSGLTFAVFGYGLDLSLPSGTLFERLQDFWG